MKEFTVYDMKSFFFITSLWLLLIWTSSAHAQSTVIYEDDFEGAVSGWSDNSTDFAPAVTNFLGRFATGQTSTSRTFTMPADTDELVMEFDLYRFDSWDNVAEFGFDRFEVEIDGTEIFSLPFPNPQAARSGLTGNVDWSHTPLTDTEELGFNSGEFWFDQLHRFVITVNNPGATVSLTLRADLSQEEFDESAGYDNFLVTAQGPNNDISAVVETFAAIDGDSGGTTPSVLTSDTINSVILDPNDVTITTATSSSTNVVLDQSTGLITVAANTPAGTYTVEYEICENINLSNCSSVTETVTVFVPGGSGVFCPAGTVVTPGTYHVITATGGNRPNRAVGAPLPEGSVGNNGNSGRTFFPSVIYDLTGDPDILIPEGTVIEVSLASHFNSNAQIAISSSLDNTNFPAAGSNGSQFANLNSTNNIFIYFDYTVPAGGARFMELDHQFGGVRFDGVIYDTQCQTGSAPTTLSAAKNVAVYDPFNQGLYALPGTDVIYTITVENTGTGGVDSGSLVLIDAMPAEVIFFNGDIDDAGPEVDPITFQDTGGGLSFDPNADIGFSSDATHPGNFSNCTYTPIAGYDPDVTYICINPKGVMAGQSTMSVSFRARIE